MQFSTESAVTSSGFSFIDFLTIISIFAINSFFVLAEVSILTSSKAKLYQRATSGSKGAQKAIKLIREPEVFLSTVLVGVSLMSIILGLYGGSSTAQYLEGLLRSLPYINDNFEEYLSIISSTLSILIITFFTVFSEVIPKRIAMMSPERFAVVIAHLMPFFILLFYPIVLLLTNSTKYVLRILRIKTDSGTISIEELKFLINQAENTGVLEKTERDIMRRLVNISNVQVGAIMTPRNKMITLDIKDADIININKLKQHKFNYFPIIDNDLNKLIGIVPIKKLLNRVLNNELLLQAAKDFNITYVPEMAKITKIIEIFREKNIEIALVLDEYGEIEGLVTLNDILKTFIGDVAVSTPGRKNNLIKKREDQFLISGNVPIEEVMELLSINSLPEEDDQEYRTLASFVLKQLNTLPKVGNKFNASGWEFKVVKMDGLRVDRVLATREKIEGFTDRL